MKRREVLKSIIGVCLGAPCVQAVAAIGADISGESVALVGKWVVMTDPEAMMPMPANWQHAFKKMEFQNDFVAPR